MLNYKGASDAELVALLKESNEAAFNELFARYKGVLQVHAYKKLGSFEEARDVIQELFMVFWEKRDRLPDSFHVSAYLYRSMRNKIIDIFIHQKVADRYYDSFRYFRAQGHCVTADTVRFNELAREIEVGIQSLPPKMRAIFYMSRQQGMNHKEIAVKLSISENTVKNHIKGALKILKTRLGLYAYLSVYVHYYFFK